MGGGGCFGGGGSGLAKKGGKVFGGGGRAVPPMERKVELFPNKPQQKNPITTLPGKKKFPKKRPKKLGNTRRKGK